MSRLLRCKLLQPYFIVVKLCLYWDCAILSCTVTKLLCQLYIVCWRLVFVRVHAENRDVPGGFSGMFLGGKRNWAMLLSKIESFVLQTFASSLAAFL